MRITHDTCAALSAAIDAFIAKADSDIEQALKAAGYIDIPYTMRAIRRLEDRLSSLLNRETRRIVKELKTTGSIEEFIGGAFGAMQAQVRQASSDSKWAQCQSDSKLGRDVTGALRDEFERTVPRLVDEYLKTTDMYLTADTIGRRTTDWIYDWSRDLGKMMQLTSHREIETILTRNLRDGRGVADAARDLMDAGIRSNYTRARSTALTEMLTAHSASNQEAYMQSPAVEGKMWRHTGSRHNKPRPNHVDMDGEVVGKNDRFTLDGADGWTHRPMYPRDTTLPAGERVNCHCITQPVVNEDVLGMPLDERRALQQQAIADDDESWLADIDRQNRERREREALLNPLDLPDEPVPEPEPEQSGPPEPTIAGVARGAPMTHEQADSGKVNPHVNSVEPGYRTNCQSSVVTYEARLRGYDVEVVPNDYDHPMCNQLSSWPALAYLEPDGSGDVAYYELASSWTWQGAWEGPPPTAKRFEKKLMGMLEEDARYTMEFSWKSGNAGHIVNIAKKNGVLTIYDPQVNRTYVGKEVSEYLTRIKYQRPHFGTKYYEYPGILRVDNKPFNFQIVDQIMQKAGAR